MLTNVSETSLAAYRQLEADGKLPPQRVRVLDAITKHGALTREELAGVTGMRLSAICGRVADLIKDGHLIEQGSKVNPTSGVLNKLVRLPVGQQGLFQ
jgi:hypothetical protein